MPEWVQDDAQPSGWRWTGDDPPSGRIDYGGTLDYTGPTITVDVPERLDGWCEDRMPEDLSDADGTD